MKRLFLFGLLAIAILVGTPYAAWMLNSLMGTYTVTMVEHDGSQRVLTLGPNAPVPDWMPALPGALVVQASRWAPTPQAVDSGDLEVLSHQDFDSIKGFYREAFEQRGFVVEDLGIGTLNPAAAAYLGLDGQLAANRSVSHLQGSNLQGSNLQVTVQLRSPEGLIVRPRLVQIHWAQTIAPPQ
jgi:hypothetical protein